LSFTLNEAEPPELVSPSELSELESQIEQKNQRISELESQLEQKNQTIIELESQVEELESQSSNPSGDGNGGVTIDVTVNPANRQENFVEGGQAVVQAESENADVSEMQVEYGAGTYQLDSSGEVAIPLANTGTQEMTLVYEDTTEEVTIDVEPRDGQNQQEQQNQQDSDGSGAFGPGFGVVAAMIALLAVAFLVGRYR
jgi:PGF-CTERM protein